MTLEYFLGTEGRETEKLKVECLQPCHRLESEMYL